MPPKSSDFNLGDEVVVISPFNVGNDDHIGHIGIIIDILIGVDYPIEINFPTIVDIEYFKAEELKLVKDLTPLEKALYGL